ncbi:Gfo/Idh/MocA family protein [Pseudoroseicyclus tamaricis]|uniref:Gfo/Idh/MocA family oxidoreductase n=1 Tax=Pseudoroseicyclus tamaricis TaxID=2705421 RepID=A0A6B2JG32_9RHOB|nr:Gfo/Idh/MocA family oxidoreductase [Pseudoroseicyclus tamaricis]NDV00073.1 Gfo/Idh/MocA family oxidoreductase [Pseudoroseicyclus tamaricis]
MSQKVGLVGIGKIARDQHIPAIAGSEEFELAATASRNAGVDGVAGYGSLAELLEAEPDVGCISLCTPPQVRYADARAALEAGRHVMLEKPPGATLSEVHDLQALAAHKGVTLFASWHSRMAAAVLPARAWLSQRDVTAIRVSWREDVRQWHPGQDWVWQAGGLGVFDPGINALSVLTAIMPRAIHLAEATLDFPENRDTPVAADLTFRDPLGAEVTARFDWLHEGPPEWDIHIEAGESALLSHGGARFSVAGEEIAGGEDREYPGLYARFAELIAAGESEVDLSPLTHVADAFTLGQRRRAAPFHW